MYELDLSHLVRLGPRRVQAQLPVTMRSCGVIDIAWSSELSDAAMKVETTESYRLGQDVDVDFVDDEQHTWTLKARVTRVGGGAGVRLSFLEIGREERLRLVALISRLGAMADAEQAEDEQLAHV